MLTSCIKVAESNVSASSVRWRGATLTWPSRNRKTPSFKKWRHEALYFNGQLENNALIELFSYLLPAIARPHWSRSHATAHASVLPVVGRVVTNRTKSALATPSTENGKTKNDHALIFPLIHFGRVEYLLHTHEEVEPHHLDHMQNNHLTAGFPSQAQQREFS